MCLETMAGTARLEVLAKVAILKVLHLQNTQAPFNQLSFLKFLKTNIFRDSPPKKQFAFPSSKMCFRFRCVISCKDRLPTHVGEAHEALPDGIGMFPLQHWEEITVQLVSPKKKTYNDSGMNIFAILCQD